MTIIETVENRVISNDEVLSRFVKSGKLVKIRDLLLVSFGVLGFHASIHIALGHDFRLMS